MVGVQVVCLANVQNKGPQLLIFQCKMNHRLVGLQERGDHWITGKFSSGTTARARILEIEPCKNTLILPGSSPSFCYWLCYRPINFLMSFPGSALIPLCCQCEQPPGKDLCSRGARTWSMSPFLALQVQNLIFSLCGSATKDLNSVLPINTDCSPPVCIAAKWCWTAFKPHGTVMIPLEEEVKVVRWTTVVVGGVLNT